MRSTVVPLRTYRCTYCPREDPRFRCPKCGTRYCGKECQKKDWPQHKQRFCTEQAAKAWLADMDAHVAAENELVLERRQTETLALKADEFIWRLRYLDYSTKPASVGTTQRKGKVTRDDRLDQLIGLSDVLEKRGDGDVYVVAHIQPDYTFQLYGYIVFAKDNTSKSYVYEMPIPYTPGEDSVTEDEK